MRRPRGPGGRFLTAEEVAAGGKGENAGEDLADKTGIESNSKNSLASSRSSGNKRKASSVDDKSIRSAKRMKPDTVKESTSAEDSDEPDEDDEGEEDT